MIKPTDLKHVASILKFQYLRIRKYIEILFAPQINQISWETNRRGLETFLLALSECERRKRMILIYIEKDTWHKTTRQVLTPRLKI